MKARVSGSGGVALLFLALSGAACGKTMTEAECKRVGAHLREVWDAEANATAPEASEPSERAKHAIKGEGDRMESEWLSQCRRELEGRTVDAREIDCIVGSKTAVDLKSCATPKQ